MQTGFQDIIFATVRCAKMTNSLLWADQMADRIADATPISVNPADLADELTAAAIREGVPVTVARARSRRRVGRH
jgi:hypothetical protein